MLGALDIPTSPIELPGVYDGQWKGSGEIFQSVCPATGEVLAHVKSVSCSVCSVCRCPSCLMMLVTAPRVLTAAIHTTILTPAGITGGAPWRTGADEGSIRLFQKYTRAQERRDNPPDSRGSGCQGALL